MNNVKAILKNYPLAVISVVLLVVAIVGLFVLVIPAGAAFVKDMSARSQDINRLKTLQQNQEQIPPATPDGPPQTVDLVINTEAINRLRDIYKKMDEEYTGIFQYAQELNQNGEEIPNPHVPMLDGLFPTPSHIGKPFDAKVAYREALSSMLRRYDPDALYPRVDAAPPLSAEVLAEETLKVEQDYLVNVFLDPEQRDVKNLSPEQFETLQQKKLNKVFDLYKAHAQSIHVYAETDINSDQFPLQVDPWSLPGDQPTIEDLWFGQVRLWVIQDIMRAIEVTNQASDRSKSVLTAPVKHLLKVEVPDLYVGIMSQGGFQEKSTSGRRDYRVDVSRSAANVQQAPTDYEAGRTGGTPGETPPAQDVNTISADKPLQNDFAIAATGRQSNEIYDVHHATLEVIVESGRIPQLMNNLAKVNFMTVLRAKVTNVDEYEPLKQGYVYGQQDAVRLELLIETIWLRNWTKQYMPQDVKYALGVEKRPAATATTTTP